MGELLGTKDVGLLGSLRQAEGVGSRHRRSTLGTNVFKLTGRLGQVVPLPFSFPRDLLNWMEQAAERFVSAPHPFL